MASAKSREELAAYYEASAQTYFRSQLLDHSFETTRQARQRETTLASLALLKVRRPDVQVFNELLVQYPRTGRRKLGQVVPDNMVVLARKPVRAEGSYNLPLEQVRPFWVLEYVSRNNPRKDYEDSLDKYERDLEVPYYLTFYPDQQELTLYRHTGKKYASVKPNKQGRYPIRELDLEVGLLDGWVRYWHEGKLLPLPADLQLDLDEAHRRADELRQRLEEEQATRRALEEELARLRDLLPPPQARRNNGAKGNH
jgi:Uma2 family endonuclease